ncbi:MAG: DUF4249 domain-containing protein [Ignavibacteria bacterium]|nr:DUF4249 domain-containing protein [Ignavibacteria bacterium]
MIARLVIVLGSIALLFPLPGCEEPFSPKGPFEESLVVYAILSNKSDTQYVRLYTTYNPSGFDPLERTTDTPVTDADVVLQSSRGTSGALNDTMIVRWDKSRYQSDIRAYVLNNHRVEQGSTYTLRITSPGRDPVEATARVPEIGSVSIENSFALSQPDRFPENFVVRARLSSVALGYYVRFVIDYDIKRGGIWRSESIEVPESIADVVDCRTYRAVYPRLTRRAFRNDPESAVFENRAYQQTLGKLWGDAGDDSLRVRQARVELMQVEPHLYRYYNVVNGFQDERSIRSDEPDYSNIKGAVGIFGAFFSQSTIYELPPTMGFQYRCR